MIATDITPTEALRLPLDINLAAFVSLLQRMQVPHRVSEEAGEQVLWVPDERFAAITRELYARYPQGESKQQSSLALRRQQSAAWFGLLRASPVTTSVLLASLLVAVISLMGRNFEVVSWFNLLNFRVEGSELIYTPLLESLYQGQLWRLVSSMLLHFWIPGFGPLHLLMNAMWFWELGRRIEARQGSGMLLLLTLLFSLVASLSQFFVSGEGISGGLSGVLYGLLGHCWIFQKIAPTPAYRLPSGVVGFMLIWLIICLSNVFSALGVAAVANAAHVGGLLIGCLTGLVAGALARLRR